MPVSLVSLVNLRPGMKRDNDDNQDASHCESEMLDAVPSASGSPHPLVSLDVLSVCSADSRTRELIRCQHGHCDIVSWVGSDPKGAGCAKHPASEILFGDSCPTYLGCTLSLMLAERIRQNLRSLFLNGSVAAVMD